MDQLFGLQHRGTVPMIPIVRHRPSPSTLSDAEKAKLLQEVEAQQADFGIQK